MALFGQTGSHTSQFTHCSVILSDIGFPAGAARASRRGEKARPEGRAANLDYFISTKRYTAPLVVRAVATVSLSAGAPMKSTITPLKEPACDSLKASWIRPEVSAEFGPPKAIILPGSTPRDTVVLTFSSWLMRASCAAWSSPAGTKYMYGVREVTPCMLRFTTSTR